MSPSPPSHQLFLSFSLSELDSSGWGLGNARGKGTISYPTSFWEKLGGVAATVRHNGCREAAFSVRLGQVDEDAADLGKHLPGPPPDLLHVLHPQHAPLGTWSLNCPSGHLAND